MSDFKTSLLVNRQVPEFVRDDHPNFVSFLEAYYEYLETKQGTQLNDLTKRAKELKDLSDVDASISDFEKSFFNTYAPLITTDVAADKETLLKNVLPLYLNKGSEKSFKLLFRLLFGEELEISYPRDNLLIASGGQWQIQNAVKIGNEVFSTYTGDGTTVEFKLLQDNPIESLSVSVNGVLKTNGVDFVHRKESKKIIFNTAPADGDNIQVGYLALRKDVFSNRQITGVTSGTTALVEKVLTRVINNERVTELYINSKTIIGSFFQGEELTTSIFSDDVLVNVKLKSVSTLASIIVGDGGANYNVGDPVIVSSTLFDEEATAVVSKVFSGTLDKVAIVDGGAGFEQPAEVYAAGYSNTLIRLATDLIDTSGANAVSNVFTIFTDIISDIDPANTTINATDYGFPNSEYGVSNVESVLNRTLGEQSYTDIGSIANVAILTSSIIFADTPTLNSYPALLNVAPQTANTTSNISVRIDTFGSLGKLIISSAGTGYEEFDEIIFNNKPMSYGFGAAAQVTTVSAEGAIERVEFVPSKVNGTANVTASSTTVTGTDTWFKQDLIVGDKIMVGAETRTIDSIASNTSLQVTSAFSRTLTDKPVRLWGLNLLGGQNYKQSKLPTAQVVSSNVSATGASITVTAIQGDGEQLDGSGSKRPGEIEEISIINPGSGFLTIPVIDLADSGDGTATANAVLTPIYETFPGSWNTTDGLLSSIDRKLQGRDYYIKYSYLLSSTQEFSKFKKIFKELLHPAGFKSYAEYKFFSEIEATDDGVNTVTAPKNVINLSGTVNVNSSIYVTGTNTKFFVAANNLGLLTYPNATYNVVSTVAIANGGSGYAVSDILTPTGGVSGNIAIIRVSEVDAHGNVIKAQIVESGDYTTNPTAINNPFVSNTGSGINFTANVTTLQPGTYIAVNSEIRLINTILSNTTIVVTQPFTQDANNQELVVINTGYTAITTEATYTADTLDISAENELILKVES